MPVLPTYQPTQAPGANVQNFLNAYDQTSSIMERKQRLSMAQDNQDMERAKFQAYLPAIVAKGQADVATAGASIANATRIEMLRTKAAQSSTDYNDRFLNIMSIPDDKDRSDTLGAFMGEVSWLDNPALPEYQGFAKAVREERAKSFTMAATNLKLDQHLDDITQQVEGRKAVAQIQADAKTSNAQTYSGSREKIAAINADTKLGVEDKKAAKQGIQLADLQDRASQAEQDAADAERDGNPKLAQSYRVAAANFRDAIQHTTTFSGYAPSAAKPKSEDPRATAKQPYMAPKPITLTGKNAPDEVSAAAPKLYSVDPTTKSFSFSPAVKTPVQIQEALRQAQADGAMTPEQIRDTLTRLGFRKK